MLPHLRVEGLLLALPAVVVEDDAFLRVPDDIIGEQNVSDGRLGVRVAGVLIWVESARGNAKQE